MNTNDSVEYIFRKMDRKNISMVAYMLQNNGMKSIKDFLETDIEPSLNIEPDEELPYRLDSSTSLH